MDTKFYMIFIYLLDLDLGTDQVYYADHFTSLDVIHRYIIL